MAIPLEQLLACLNQGCLQQENTRLLGGFDEPLYVPETSGRPAEIRFTRDYYRSALHELAHWCIAGPERRRLLDYGYWYVPDGRNQRQQEAFYRCEIKPQAIERAFAAVCGVGFDVSVDNLGQPVAGVEKFRQQVQACYRDYVEMGFPQRAELILRQLLACGDYNDDVYAFLREAFR